LVRKWVQAFVDKVQQQRCLEAQCSDMVYVPPEEPTLERSPESIPLPFPESSLLKTLFTRPAPEETVPEPSLLKTLLTHPASEETVSEPSPPEPILLKSVETPPLLPTHRKRSLETPLCSLPNKIVKSEPSEEDDVRLLWKVETIETTQRTPKAFVDKVQQQRCLEAQCSDMVYVPPEEPTLERSPESIPLPFPESSLLKTLFTRPAPEETVPEPSLLKTLLTHPASEETVSEPSPPEPILLKSVETPPLLPTHRKRSLETPLCSLPNKIVKSEPSEEDDVRLLWKVETIETTQRTPKVGDFV
ncbi:hypothetical protein NPIL_11761, partial [Nephila pilipes]